MNKTKTKNPRKVKGVTLHKQCGLLTEEENERDSETEKRH